MLKTYLTFEFANSLKYMRKVLSLEYSSTLACVLLGVVTSSF